MADDTILRKLQALPPDKRQEAIDFIDSLLQQAGSASGGFFGLWAGLKADVKVEDLEQARREMWDGFPRADLP